MHAPEDAIILLDEPDTFINPLQLMGRFLFKDLQDIYKKSVILCTHSSELMLCVDTASKALNYMTELHAGRARSMGDSLEFVRAMKVMGSAAVTPKQLAQLAHTPYLLVFENEGDHRFVRELLPVVYPKEADLHSRFAAMLAIYVTRPKPDQILGMLRSLKQFVQNPVVCVFADSDFYRSEHYTIEAQKYQKAGIPFFRWDRREFESYYLNHDALWEYFRTPSVQHLINRAGVKIGDVGFRKSFWSLVRVGLTHLLECDLPKAAESRAIALAEHKFSSAEEVGRKYFSGLSVTAFL